MVSGEDRVYLLNELYHLQTKLDLLADWSRKNGNISDDAILTLRQDAIHMAVLRECECGIVDIDLKARERALKRTIKRDCSHLKFSSDGHCSDMECWNYYSRCKRHAPSGTESAVCTRVGL